MRMIDLTQRTNKSAGNAMCISYTLRLFGALVGKEFLIGNYKEWVELTGSGSAIYIFALGKSFCVTDLIYMYRMVYPHGEHINLPYFLNICRHS